jgi:hypothetical protein
MPAQGRRQRGMVEIAQVAAEPDEGGGHVRRYFPIRLTSLLNFVHFSGDFTTVAAMI